MKMIRKAGLWLVLLNKRFLKKYIFTLLLCLAPVLVLGMRLVSSEESGILHILLYDEDTGEDPSGEQVIDQLLHRKGIVVYERTKDPEAAKEMVRRGKADSLWIFPSGLRENLSLFLEGKKTEFLTVCLREDTVQTRLVREQLYGVMYPLLSYELTENFVKSQKEFAGMDENALEKELRNLYEENRVKESIFSFAYLDGTRQPETTGAHTYLTAPLRGMLAVLVLLCALAITMFYLQDQEEQIFHAMPIRFRRGFPLLYLLIGTLDGAIAAGLALYFSGTFTVWYREVLLLIVYALAVTGFCNLLRIFNRNIHTFGAGIPVLLLVTLVLCPVFLSIRKFPAVQYLLPTYYYLNSLHSSQMFLWMLLYTAITWCVGLAVSR